ncbi:hypothetical protein M3Y99_00367600 [Aphelenchoides fujianensis]|nr:hypothetical protein M3Y99_00367600 [Aphelenchoides fujianensis]
MSASTSTSGPKSADAIIAALRTPTASTLRSITKLKQKLKTKKNAVDFIDNSRPVFHAILQNMDRLINQPPPATDAPPSSHEAPLIKELVSVAANLCHLAFGAAFEINKVLPNFTTTALRVLESATFEHAIKSSMLRLLGNIAEYHETASMITHAPILLDRVVLMVNDEQPAVSEAALRTVRILCKHRSYARSIVLTNGAYSVGLLFAKKEIREILKDGNLLKIFDALQSSTLLVPVGRQLASGKCAPKFLELLLCEEKGKELEKLQTMVLHFTKHSFDLREAFGKETIAQLVALQCKSRRICAFLSYFARDAWSRQALRTEFGLHMILERLSETRSLEEKAEIVSELRQYIHDQTGLSFICHRPELLSVFITLTSEFLDEKEATKCAEDESAVEDSLEAAVNGEFEPRFSGPFTTFRDRRHHDFTRVLPAYDYTPSWYSRSPSSSLSPSTSPPRSADESWDSGSAQSGSSNRNEEPSTSAERYRPSVRESTIRSPSLRAITNSYNTESDFLIKRETLTFFIRYLAEGILDEEYAVGGSRRTYALMHGVAVIHHIDRRNRFYARYDPINALLKTFGETLVNRKEESKKEDDKLLLDITIALSLLVSRRYLVKLIGPRTADGQHEANGECPLRVPAADEPQLCVRREDGSLLMAIGKEDGLLGHDLFLENQNTYVDFVFNPEAEACDEEDFVVFLHFLSNCRNTECVRIEDAKTCAALLHLSDKYTCTELSETLLASNGAVRRFIDGSNLLAFIPIACSNWIIKDRVGALLSIVFFKFSTDAQLIQIFDSLSGNQVAVELFVDLLTDFFRSVADCFRSSVLMPAWDFV